MREKEFNDIPPSAAWSSVVETVVPRRNCFNNWGVTACDDRILDKPSGNIRIVLGLAEKCETSTGSPITKSLPPLALETVFDNDDVVAWEECVELIAESATDVSRCRRRLKCMRLCYEEDKLDTWFIQNHYRQFIN